MELRYWGGHGGAIQQWGTGKDVGGVRGVPDPHAGNGEGHGMESQIVTCNHRIGKRRRVVGGLGGGTDGSSPTERWRPEGRTSSKAADEWVLLSVVLLPTAGQARGNSWLVVWAADTAAPAWIQRRGGQIEADGEVVGRRRGELQGGGVVPWRLPSL
uniref:Uncharacterized protein n=1 Tax=Aegilops tauschii TaxID=37682 RepID=N1QP35_AEGTA